MKLYHFTPDVEHYGYIEFVEKYTHEAGFPISGQFHLGQSIVSSWQPVAVKSNTLRGELGDFPRALVGPPVFSERAWDVLGPLLGEAVEALPIITPSGPYLAINVLKVISCLDYSCSDLTWYPKEMMRGGLHRIIKYCFNPAPISGHPIFKIPEEMTRTIISEEVEASIKDASLKGLNFSQCLFETGD